MRVRQNTYSGLLYVYAVENINLKPNVQEKLRLVKNMIILL